MTNSKILSLSSGRRQSGEYIKSACLGGGGGGCGGGRGGVGGGGGGGLLRRNIIIVEQITAMMTIMITTDRGIEIAKTKTLFDGVGPEGGCVSVVELLFGREIELVVALYNDFVSVDVTVGIGL